MGQLQWMRDLPLYADTVIPRMRCLFDVLERQVRVLLGLDDVVGCLIDALGQPVAAPDLEPDLAGIAWRMQLKRWPLSQRRISG